MDAYSFEMQCSFARGHRVWSPTRGRTFNAVEKWAIPMTDVQYQ